MEKGIDMKIFGRIILVCVLMTLVALPVLGQETAQEDAEETAPAETQEEVQASSSGSSTSQTLSRFGLRAGYTDWKNLSQFHFGAHYLAGEIMPNVEFTPNIEIGVGDNTTVVAVQADVAYQFTEFVQRPWGMYGGGCLAFNYKKESDFDSETDLGLSLLAGGKYNFASGRQGMVEIRVGIMDSPSFKVTVGTTIF